MLDLLLLIACIILLGGFALLFDWRNGAILVLLVGFLQDPLRKLVPDQPVFLTVSVVGVVALMILPALSKVGGIRLSPLFHSHQNLAFRIWLFAALVSVQAFITFVKTGSYILPIIGFLAYLLPFILLWLGYNYFQSFRDFEKLIALYVFCCSIAAIGLFLSWLGVDWPILQSVGEGLEITDSRVAGGILEAHSGFLRSPEIAAWHMGTATCSVLLMGFIRTDRRWGLWTISLVPFFIAAGLLTGRRKMIVIVISFVLVYLLQTVLLGQQRGRTKLISAILLVLAILMALQLDTASPLQDYWIRGSNSFDEFLPRLQGLGLETVWNAVQVGGLFGLGAGLASQGSQHFVTGIQGSAEGGMGKITLELGLPGLILVFWLAWGLGQYLWQLLRQIQLMNPLLLSLFLGITAFLISNVAAYTIASQAFGDPFILIILGTCLSFVLAAPRLIYWSTIFSSYQEASCNNGHL
ncbi:hypothetical protein H6G04_15425 [Calothrix membranacea FACHB-236]|nr:hypothetical protein [Calothrix membranacea FACHB-236]